MSLLPHRGIARLGAQTRFQLARRPWIRWLLVTGLAGGVGLAVHAALARVDAERSRWAEVDTVAVASTALEPGDPISYEWRTLPLAALPPDRVTSLPGDATVRQRVTVGEVITAADLAIGPGPAAAADSGQVVVPVSDPLVVAPPIGATVRVYSDGLVLAADARIVDVVDDVVYVAVDERDGPAVAAAAQFRQASIVFVP